MVCFGTADRQGNSRTAGFSSGVRAIEGRCVTGPSLDLQRALGRRLSHPNWRTLLSTGISRFLAVRNYLRTHPDAAQSDGDLKRRLAAQFQHDIDGYVGGKTDAILNNLRDSGVPPDKLEAIEHANRKSGWDEPKRCAAEGLKHP
jgi:hypothetical protein